MHSPFITVTLAGHAGQITLNASSGFVEQSDALPRWAVGLKVAVLSKAPRPLRATHDAADFEWVGGSWEEPYTIMAGKFQRPARVERELRTIWALEDLVSRLEAARPRASTRAALRAARKALAAARG